MTIPAHKQPITHTVTSDAHELGSTHETPSDSLGFFRGMAVALPIGLMLWAAIVAAAWWMWRG